MKNLQNIDKKTNGIIKASELAKEGFTRYEIKKMLNGGVIEKIKHGYYRLFQSENYIEADLISKLFPDGVICMYSALFYYAYSDRTPLAWDIAIDKDVSKARFNLDYPFVKPYYLESHLLEFGVVKVDYDGYEMNIFDRNRLICECLKYENKIDKETFNKAIQGYINDSKKSIDKLLKYAEQRRILKKVKDRIGVWL